MESSQSKILTVDFLFSMYYGNDCNQESGIFSVGQESSIQTVHLTAKAQIKCVNFSNRNRICSIDTASLPQIRIIYVIESERCGPTYRVC